jgi:CheY-like chemotaxis protein
MRKAYIVEDDKDSADLVVELLSDELDINIFSNAGDLLAFLQMSDTVTPHIFILDISLPGMDGVTLLRRIRDDGRFQNTPVLALTAHAMKGDKESFISSGFDGYISKPIVDEQALLDEIERVIAEKH